MNPNLVNLRNTIFSTFQKKINENISRYKPRFARSLHIIMYNNYTTLLKWRTWSTLKCLVKTFNIQCDVREL